MKTLSKLLKNVGVDAIHPGYGFLSENIAFARRCEEEGLIFIGPTSEHLNMFGDKVKARDQAVQADIPVIPGSDGPVEDLEEIRNLEIKNGYPLMIKAAMGGGGRGMRVVRSAETLSESYDRARSEARAAFGSDDVYVEKLIEEPKHIEVQIIGDHEGNIVHLYERDCSVQRRHQKVVEVAPSVSLDTQVREKICHAAVQLMDNVGYINAGTVEFLVTGGRILFYRSQSKSPGRAYHYGNDYGVDIVQTQILIAEGHALHSSEVAIPHQDEIRTHGYAIQSRVTTEDPLNNFMPDTGKIMAYRTGGGFGVRLDAGNGFQGAVISPYYDSLLVKLSTWALNFDQAAHKMVRNLKEFRIRGIKTNIPFLENVIQHKQFLNGEYNTMFIDRSPELFVFPKRKDRGTKMLSYIADRTINGFEGYGNRKKPTFHNPRVPNLKYSESMPIGTKQILDERGPEGLAEWLKERPEVLLTDTTFRDAHQSLLATRVRTKDLENIAEPTARLLPQLFSLEMWGGATFDVSYRF